MPIKPDNAVGAGGSNTQASSSLEEQASQNQPDHSILERLIAAPSAMAKMFTGE